MRRILGFLLATAGLCAADVELAVVPRWNGTEIAALPTAELKNEAGQTLRFTRLALLLSDAALVRADGTIVRRAGQYGVLDLAGDRMAGRLRDVPAGEYAGLQFSIGLPADTNHADPG